jgi:ribosomal protein S18 acetylase RimI-like enzyme
MEIVRLKPEHRKTLAAFFSRIARDTTSRHFHPHTFTEEDADRICSYCGKDLYVGLHFNANFLGYGMLRGWDEGFSVPSLGIYIAPEMRGTGAAKLMMQHLHLAAKLSKATQVRLKVYRDNAAALRLYRSFGYQFDDSFGDGAQVVGILSL